MAADAWPEARNVWSALRKVRRRSWKPHIPKINKYQACRQVLLFPTHNTKGYAIFFCILWLKPNGFFLLILTLWSQVIKLFLPNDAACSKQFPSPVVARGQSLWHVPVSAHQFSRPLCSRDINEDNSIRSFSRKRRKSSKLKKKPIRLSTNYNLGKLKQVFK